MTIAPTLDLAEASRHLWDVTVVGAGPSGALAARELAQLGASVLLVDKASFPRSKVCGSFLNGRVWATLAAVGLGDLGDRLGAVPIRQLYLAARCGRALIPLGQARMLSREAFDAALVEAAVAAGAHFLPTTQAALRTVTAGVRLVRLRQREEEGEAAARLVLAANGLGSTLLHHNMTGPEVVAPASRIGAAVVAPARPDFYQAGVIYMVCGREGYVGLSRLEDGRLDIGTALDREAIRRRGGPGQAAAALLAEEGMPPVPELANLAWRGTPCLTRQPVCIAAERAFAIGDATGYVEPFTGEGIAWAVTAATAVVPLVKRALHHWQPSLTTEWIALHHRVVGRRQYPCWLLAAALRRPRLCQGLIRVLVRWPWLAAPLVSLVD